MRPPTCDTRRGCGAGEGRRAVGAVWRRRWEVGSGQQGGRGGLGSVQQRPGPGHPLSRRRERRRRGHQPFAASPGVTSCSPATVTLFLSPPDVSGKEGRETGQLGASGGGDGRRAAAADSAGGGTGFGTACLAAVLVAYALPGAAFSDSPCWGRAAVDQHQCRWHCYNGLPVYSAMGHSVRGHVHGSPVQGAAPGQRKAMWPWGAGA